MKTNFMPQYDPKVHTIVEAVGFVPGDFLTLKIHAKSLGMVFICKAVSEDPVVEVETSYDQGV